MYVNVIQPYFSSYRHETFERETLCSWLTLKFLREEVPSKFCFVPIRNMVLDFSEAVESLTQHIKSPIRLKMIFCNDICQK